jgi:Predicted Permease Membrane Region
VVGLWTSGTSLLIAGLVTVLVPHLVGVIVGRWAFKMEPGILLGVCAGPGTATPALAAIQKPPRAPFYTRVRRVVRGGQRASGAVGHRDRRAPVKSGYEQTGTP